MLLRMRDFLTFQVRPENERAAIECIDAQRTDLLARADATHSGIINGNGRFYRPDRMQRDCHLWVPKDRSPLPVLRSHDQNGEVLGRIVEAKYIDQSYLYANTHPAVKNTIFYAGGTSKRMNLYDSVNWVVNNLSGLKDYRGLGYIELGLKVTNPDAVDKVLRDEYLTVSVGFITDAAVCSICHTDWAQDGKCEHSSFLGRTVDGKRMFLITGGHRWEEMSFVNFPADPFGAITSKEAVAAMVDSIASRAFFIGLPVTRQSEILQLEDALTTTDGTPLIGSDIELVMEDEVNKMDINLDSVLSDIKNPELTKERALELRQALDGMTTEDADQKKTIKRAKTSLTALIRKNGWDAQDSDTLTRDQVEARIATLTETLEKLDGAEARQAYIDKLEAQAKVFGLEFAAPKTETPADPVEAQDAATEQTVPETPAFLKGLDEKAVAFFTDSDAGKACVGTISQLDKDYQATSDEDRYYVRECLRALIDSWHSNEYLAYLKGKLCADAQAPEVLVDKGEYETLQDAVEAGETQIKSIKDSLTAAVAANETLVKEQKRILAQSVVLYSIVAGETGYQGLDSAQIQEEITAKSAKALISLTDAMEEILDKKLPNFVRKTADAKPSEVVSRVSDTAKVEAAATTPTDIQEVKDAAVTPTDQGGIGESEMYPVLTKQDLLALARQKAAASYRKTKKTE